MFVVKELLMCVNESKKQDFTNKSETNDAHTLKLMQLESMYWIKWMWAKHMPLKPHESSMRFVFFLYLYHRITLNVERFLQWNVIIL